MFVEWIYIECVYIISYSQIGARFGKYFPIMCVFTLNLYLLTKCFVGYILSYNYHLYKNSYYLYIIMSFRRDVFERSINMVLTGVLVTVSLPAMPEVGKVATPPIPKGPSGGQTYEDIAFDPTRKCGGKDEPACRNRINVCDEFGAWVTNWHPPGAWPAGTTPDVFGFDRAADGLYYPEKGPTAPHCPPKTR